MYGSRWDYIYNLEIMLVEGYIEKYFGVAELSGDWL